MIYDKVVLIENLSFFLNKCIKNLSKIENKTYFIKHKPDLLSIKLVPTAYMKQYYTLFFLINLCKSAMHFGL